jgi:hypothetical protein
MNTGTLPLILFFVLFVMGKYYVAPNQVKPHEVGFVRFVYVLLAVGFTVYMLFFTSPPPGVTP